MIPQEKIEEIEKEYPYPIAKTFHKFRMLDVEKVTLSLINRYGRKH